MRDEVVPDRLGFRISVDENNGHSEFLPREFCRATIQWKSLPPENKRCAGDTTSASRAWPSHCPAKTSIAQLWHPSKQRASLPRCERVEGRDFVARFDANSPGAIGVMCRTSRSRRGRYVISPLSSAPSSRSRPCLTRLIALS